MTAARTVAALALLLVALASPLAQGQESLESTGDLYLRSDGTLTREAGGAATSCLSLSGPGASAQTASFVTELADGHYAPRAETLTVLVALAGSNGAPQSGTGFTLAGTATFGGNLTTESQPQNVAPGQSPTSLSLTFALPDEAAEVEGPLDLSLTLTPAQPVGPVTGAQDVNVLCDTPDTRLAAFTIATEHAAGAGDAHAGEEEGAHDDEPISLATVMTVALLAALATLVAGAIVLAGRTVSQRRIHLLLGATAGLLLAVAILDLIPEAVELTESAPYTIAFGVLGLFLVRWAAGDHAHGHSGHARAEGAHAHDADPDVNAHASSDHAKLASHSTKLALIAFFALSFHRFVDGLVLPAAFELDSLVGFAAAGAVLIHQFPDGIAAATIFLAAGWRRVKVMQGVGVMAVLTPLGSLAGLLFLNTEGIVGHLVALAAATFIFISLAELLPELQGREHRFPVAMGFTLGVLGAFALTLLAGLFGGHGH